jgi:diguanylate cyclase (GGDEF)-like protein
MVNIKPIDIGRFGLKEIIAFLILIGVAIIGNSFKIIDFCNFFVLNGTLLNWHFVLLLLLFVIIVMDYFWNVEYNKHSITKKERDNFEEALRTSENRRLTDVITGVPNSEGLKKDIENYFPKSNKKMQCIFIDLRNFRGINEKFGFTKTNDLLRTIAQTIYDRMRRKELMYKFPDKSSILNPNNRIYRIFPGGDEFVFIIFGDQPDAIGFSNRLEGIFKEISEKTPQILGSKIEISFICVIVEMYRNDTFDDLLNRIQPGYIAAKEGKSNFTIYWYPNDIEKAFSKDQKKLSEYERARKLFQVVTPNDQDYSL